MFSQYERDQYELYEDEAEYNTEDLEDSQRIRLVPRIADPKPVGLKIKGLLQPKFQPLPQKASTLRPI